MNRYEALRHAIKAHGADTDWCGNLYIFHPMEVARRIEATKPYPLGVFYEDDLEAAVVVALLHDVLEDTDYDRGLLAANCTTKQWHALELMTHEDEDGTYREYVERIALAAEKGLPTAAVVKLADLSHNMSDERKENLTPEKLAQAERMSEQRYAPSRDRLWEALGTEWWPK